jgi:uncharacterized protein YbcV (DUF1398 family)
MVIPSNADVMRQCKELSLRGEIAFPEVVRRLQEVGVERYHADFTRDECSYYMPCGESHVMRLGGPGEPIAESFDAAKVEAAIRSIQRGEIVYVEFVRRIMAAGCVGYFVQIAGRRALYFGRNGDIHVEPFPALAPAAVIGT